MKSRLSNIKGFTLIEVTMVVLLVSILAVVAIPQFVDFRTEARNAATQAAVGALRSAIEIQTSHMQMRCMASAGKYPATQSVASNDVTDASNNSPTVCGTSWPTVATAEKQFMAQGIPDNPWSKIGTTPGTTLAANAVTTCSGTGCSPKTNPTVDCTGAGLLTTANLVGGWCYDPTTGKIWANSANNAGATTENLF